MIIPRLFLVALGFTSTIAQLLLVRELVSVFYGNELLLGLVLAAWMVWVALGAGGPGGRVGRRCAGRQKAPAAAPSTLALITVLLPVEMALVRRLPAWLTPAPGVQVALGPAALVTVAVLMPLCLALGVQFALGVAWLEASGDRAGRAYLYESLGAVVGGALFSLGLIRWLDPFQIALLVGALNVALLLLLLRDGRRTAPVALLLLALAALPLGRRLHTAALRAQYGPDLAYAADSPYGRLAVLARGAQRVFYENGLLSFETESTHPEEAIHLPMLAHPDPRRVLLVGGAVAGDLRELLHHPVERVVAVELDARVIEAAREVLPAAAIAPLDDPRVSLALDDGRRYVQAGGETFDVVILDLPEPSTGALNRFYTREFFEAVQARLREGGIFALALPSAENYWSPELARRNASLYQTLRQVFPHILVLPGETDTYLASQQPLPTDPTVWAGRMAQRGLHPAWVTPAYLSYLLTGDRLTQARRTLEATTGVRINRDLAPICYYYDLALWASRFYPRLSGLFQRAELVSVWWLALPLAAMVGLARWRRGTAAPLVVGGVGLGGMLINLTLLLGFQAQHGTLYQRVGLMVAAFMGGHALGVWTGVCVPRSRRILPGVLLGGAIGAGLLALLLSRPLPTTVFMLLALLSGGVDGMTYPLALVRTPGDAVRTARRLYTADLLGGCAGALVGGALLAPLLGIPQSCIIVALVLVAALLAAA